VTVAAAAIAMGSGVNPADAADAGGVDTSAAKEE
jgi:hypothetical protein